jgi:alanine racemase
LLVPAGVRVEAVVKADAYGHGLIPVALALEAAGADGLCVATLDEALEVREAGVQLPLLVLFPVPAHGAHEAARRRIDVTFGDADVLERTLAALARRASRGGRGNRRRLRVQLELETGLGRGGVLPEHAAALAARITAEPVLQLAGVWTHLQAAGDSANVARQVQAFEGADHLLEAGRFTLLSRHVAASGGLISGRAPAYDAVRLGLALYGIVPEELGSGHESGTGTVAGARVRLRPVMALRARPVRVAELPSGWGISYGPSFTTTRPSRIATLPLGYGDGWSRAYSDRTEALVRGRRVPLVGTVAMDAVMADVTDVPGEPVSVDDEFTLLGGDGRESIVAEELARARTTNSWEVVTSMSARLARVYTAAAEPAGLRIVAGGRGMWRASNSGTATSAISRSTRS